MFSLVPHAMRAFDLHHHRPPERTEQTPSSFSRAINGLCIFETCFSMHYTARRMYRMYPPKNLLSGTPTILRFEFLLVALCRSHDLIKDGLGMTATFEAIPGMGHSGVVCCLSLTCAELVVELCLLSSSPSSLFFVFLFFCCWRWRGSEASLKEI